jgi:hypothetical protein
MVRKTLKLPLEKGNIQKREKWLNNSMVKHVYIILA